MVQMGLFQQPAIELLRYGTGWDATLEGLITVGGRRIHLLRAFNAREGIGKAADVLPKRLFEPLAGTGYPAGTRLGALGLEWLAGQIPAAP